MPTRSLWPEGVEVHQADLTREQSARINDVLSRHVNVAEMGVVSGLTVTVNGGNNQLIDVAAGSGYALNGELVTVTIPQTAIALTDMIANHINLVVLFYAEIQSLPEPHEDLGITLNTAATASFRVVVMTPAAYAALPASNADLTTNAQDRSLIIASVVATGGALSSNNITNATAWTSTLAIQHQPINITGVFVDSISSQTNIGVGTLSWLVGGPGTLSWAAPGDSVGTPVAITLDGIYTLQSHNPAYSIVVNVILSGLSASNETDTLNVTSLYAQIVPSFSAVDNHHRHLIGTGVPTPTNPHGLTLDDIGGANNFSVKDHQSNMHAVGIEPVSDAGFLGATIVTSTPNSLSVVTASAAGGINVNGLILSSTSATPLPTSPFILSFADVTDVVQGLYEVYVNRDGSIGKNKRLLFPPASVLQTTFKVVDVSDDLGAGTRQLVYNAVAHTLQYDGGPIYTLNTILTGQVIRMLSSDRKTFIRVWYNGTTLPGSSITETLTTSPTSATGAVFLMITYSGAGSTLGQGILGYSPAQLYWDRRVYGNIDTKHVTPRLLEDVITRKRRYEYPIQVVLDGLESFTTGGLNITASAGRILRDGVDTYVSGLISTVLANTTTWIYIDEVGTIQKIDNSAVGGLFGANTRNLKIAKVVSGTSTITFIVDYRPLINERVTNLTTWSTGSNGDVWGSTEAAIALSKSPWLFDTSGNIIAILSAAQTIKSNATFPLHILAGASSSWDASGVITIGNTFATGVTIGSSIVPINAPGGVQGNLTGNVTGNCSGSSGSCTGNSATATKANNGYVIAGRLLANGGTARLLDPNSIFVSAVSGGAGSGHYTITITGLTSSAVILVALNDAGTPTNKIYCTITTGSFTVVTTNDAGGPADFGFSWSVLSL